MKIKTKKLNTIFEKIKPGLAQKDIIEQAKNIVFDGKYIFTYSGNIGVFFPFKTDFVCSVPAQELIKIVSEILDEEIDIEFLENSLKLSGKNIEVELNVLINDIQDSDKMVNQDVRFYKLPENFQQGIDLCSFAVSKDVSSYLNGIYVIEENMFGSDDLRISYFEMKSEVKKSFLIPLSSVLSLKGFELKKYGVKDGWIFFKDFDDVLFCSRLLELDYSDPSQYFEFEGKQIIFPEDMRMLVEKAEILSEGDFDIDKKITVKIKNNKVTCIGENDIGKIHTFAKMIVDTNIEFIINPIFFKRILSETNSAKIKGDRIMFETENFKHLISLCCEED